MRAATHADIPAWRQLSIDTFTETFGYLYEPKDLTTFIEETYSEDALGALLDNPEFGCWFLEDAGNLIGYVLAGPCGLPHPEVRPGDGEVKRLYVRKEFQGGGRGTALFEHALAWLDSEGPRTLWLGVWSENYGAQRLYSSYGFSHAGEYGFRVGEHRDHELIFRRPGPEA